MTANSNDQQMINEKPNDKALCNVKICFLGEMLCTVFFLHAIILCPCMQFTHTNHEACLLGQKSDCPPQNQDQIVLHEDCNLSEHLQFSSTTQVSVFSSDLTNHSLCFQCKRTGES